MERTYYSALTAGEKNGLTSHRAYLRELGRLHASQHRDFVQHSREGGHADARRSTGAKAICLFRLGERGTQISVYIVEA
jgi:hypothetical protein